MVKSPIEQRIIDALEETAADNGVDIVDVELTGATKAPCVRVRIEASDGTSLSLDEVTARTAWVSSVVEGVDPVPGSYTLEVSSAGLDRPLRRPADFIRFNGSEVELTTTAREGKKRFRGRIARADEEGVSISLEDGGTLDIPYDEVRKCSLKPTFDFKGDKKGKR